MLDRFLTPLEKHDFAECGKGLSRRFNAWYWILIAAIAVRIFIPVPDVWWWRIGQWSVTIGGWVAFFLPPSLAYKIIARRIPDKTLHYELILPIPLPRYLWGKLKVIGIVMLSYAGPFFLVGFVSDPSLSFARAFVARSLLLPDNPDLNLMVLGWVILFYFSAWVVMALIATRCATAGKMIIEIAGAYTFWLLAVLLALSWVKTSFESGEMSIFWSPLAWVNFALMLGISTLLVQSSLVKLRSII